MNFHFLYKKSLPVFMAGILAFSSLNMQKDFVLAETLPTQTTPTVLPSDAEEGDTANSFRYINGTPILTNNIYNKASTSSQAWSKVDGVYVNDKGNAIPNAVAKGIDVSHHQGEINWKKVKASDVDFAIIRCGYGQDMESQDDKYWFANADACTENNIPFGTYLYSYATTKEKAIGEAKHVLRLIDGYDLQYPIYYDLEDASMSNLSAKQLAAIAEAFCSTIEEAGYKAAIYANKFWFTTKLTDPVFDNYDRWVAEYNSTCSYTKPYTIWQCTSKGSVPGINGNADLNFVVQSGPLVPVTALTVSNPSITIKDTDTAALNVSTLPYNAFNKQVLYSSSDDTIASIDENGLVTAHKEGVVTITVQSAENPAITTTCAVTVFNAASTELPGETPASSVTPGTTQAPIQTPATTATVIPTETSTPIETPVSTTTPIPTEQPAETIALNKDSLTIEDGKTTTLSATTNSSNKISWVSSNEDIASVSAKGKITANAPGKAVITAKINNTQSASCVVYIKPSKIDNADFTAVSTNKLTLTWEKVRGASGYAIYRYDTENKEDVLIKTLSSSKSSYTFNKLNGSSGNTLAAGYKYTYKVAAYKTIEGKKYYGAKYTIKTATKPKSTKVKSLKKVNSSSAKVSWGKIGASDGYVIYLSNNSTSNFKALLTIDNPKTTSYTIPSLTKGRTYYVKICTYRKINGKTVYSGYSNTKKIKL